MSKSKLVFTEKEFKHQVNEILAAKDGVKESQLDKLANLLETREPRLNACPLCNFSVQRDHHNMMRQHLKRRCKVAQGIEPIRIGKPVTPRAAAVAASAALAGKPRPAAAVDESKKAAQNSGRKRERWYYEEIPGGDSTEESTDEDDEIAGAVAMSELSDSAEENVEPAAKIAKKAEVKEAVAQIQPAPAAVAAPVQVAEPVPVAVAAAAPVQVAEQVPAAAPVQVAEPAPAAVAEVFIQIIRADQGKLSVQEAKYLAARSALLEANRADLNALHACADECIEQLKFYASRLERNRLIAALSFNAGDLPQAHELLESASNLGKEVYKGVIAIKSLKNYYIKKNGGEETIRFTAQAIDHTFPKEPVVTGMDRAVFVMGYENAAKMSDDLIAKFETCHWVLWNLKERIKGIELIKAQSVENFNAGRFQVAKGMFLSEFFIVGVAKKTVSAPAPAASPAIAAVLAAATASVNAQLERAKTPSPPPNNPASQRPIIPAAPRSEIEVARERIIAENERARLIAENKREREIENARLMTGGSGVKI